PCVGPTIVSPESMRVPSPVLGGRRSILAGLTITSAAKAAPNGAHAAAPYVGSCAWFCKILLCVSVILWCVDIPKALAEIYVRVHKDGKKEFTNRPAGPGWMLYMTDSGVEPLVKFSERGKPRDIDSIIADISSQFAIDPHLVRAIIKAESNYNPNAVSPKGAKGLMQLMPSTAKQLKVQRPFDPEQNIIGGVKYIKGMLASYGSLDTALAAYNAGPAAVKKYAGIPPYRETEEYVKKVLGLYKRYKKEPSSKIAVGVSPQEMN
ncbi:MAG: lytic transglycosylase domain-containing protein, partial [Desulfomonilaceae bacterium]